IPERMGLSSGLLSLSVRIASEAPRWTCPHRAGARSALPELQDGDANQHPELDAHRQRDQQTPVGASLELRLADRGEEGVHRCGTSLSLLDQEIDPPRGGFGYWPVRGLSSHARAAANHSGRFQT